LSHLDVLSHHRSEHAMHSPLLSSPATTYTVMPCAAARGFQEKAWDAPPTWDDAWGTYLLGRCVTSTDILDRSSTPCTLSRITNHESRITSSSSFLFTSPLSVTDAPHLGWCICSQQRATADTALPQAASVAPPSTPPPPPITAFFPFPFLFLFLFLVAAPLRLVGIPARIVRLSCCRVFALQVLLHCTPR